MKNLKVLLLFLLSITLFSCSSLVSKSESEIKKISTQNPTPIQLPQPSPTPEIKRLTLYPINIQKSDPSNGWINYKIQIAIENPLGNPMDASKIPDVIFSYSRSGAGSLTLELSEGIVQTQEGYTYPTSGYVIDGYYGEITAGAIYIPDIFPPSFQMNAPEQITFRAAESVNPTSIVFPSYSLNLQQIASVNFQTNSTIISGMNYYEMGDEIIIPNKMKILFNNVNFDDYGYPHFNLTIESLNIGQDEILITDCYIWDNFGTVTGNTNYNFSVGPSQVKESFLNFGAYGQKLEKSSLMDRYKTSKLVCVGQINFIINFTSSD